MRAYPKPNALKSHRPIRWLFLLLLPTLLLLTTPPARAQEPNTFRVEPGQELLFDHAFEIGTLVGPGVVEDADGFLWFSSARGDGLYRRDGIEMRQFGPTGDVSLGPVTWLLTDGADPSLFWAASDDQGSIWIGCVNDIFGGSLP